MKRKLFTAFLATLMFITFMPTTANAKRNHYYTLTGTVHNFNYTMEYENGTVLKGTGFDIYTSNGNIYQMVDTDTDYHFAENAKVKVKLHDNNTPKNPVDDRIISIKKIRKAK